MAINFNNISGHDRQKRKIEILTGNNTLPGTMLLTGPPGIGKRLIAIKMVSLLFCRSGNPPCGVCHDCLRVEEGLHPDFIQLSPNERGVIPIGSEEKRESGTVRWLIDRLAMKSFSGTAAVLVDGLDRIRIDGQNALLKTIEEPSAGVHLFMVASGTSTILPTILSRCFEIKFGPLSDMEILEILGKKKLLNGHVSVIAEISGGSVETAVLLSGDTLLADVLAACGEISGFIRGAGILMDGVAHVEKKLGGERLLDILVNVYRQNLMYLMCHTEGEKASHDFFHGVFLEDAGGVMRLLNILLSAKKDLARNIDITGSLRGMIYSGMPEGFESGNSFR